MAHIPKDSEMPAKEYPLIDPGFYLAEVQQSELKYSKDGDEMWNIKMAITTQGPFWGKLVWDRIVFSKKLIERAKLIFNAFGFNTVEGYEADDPLALIGRTAQIEIIHEKNEGTDPRYAGKIQSKVRFFDGYSAADGSKPGEDESFIPF